MPSFVAIVWRNRGCVRGIWSHLDDLYLNVILVASAQLIQRAHMFVQHDIVIVLYIKTGFILATLAPFQSRSFYIPSKVGIRILYIQRIANRS